MLRPDPPPALWLPRRYGYGDPPYPGQATKHYGAEAKAAGRKAREVNHRLLITYMCDEFPDGWALSTSSPALKMVLNLCPDDVRIAVWCKPFAVFKPGVNPAYCWEPIVWRGGRARGRDEPTVRDYVIEPVHLSGFTGSKPPRFTHAVCDLLGVLPGDEVVDIFPGSGAVGEAVDGYLNRPITTPGTLFAVD